MEQPPRSALDGFLQVYPDADGTVVIVAQHDGLVRECRMGRHNAWRLFGMLAIVLGIRLPMDIVKRIRL